MRIQINLFVPQEEFNVLPTPWNNAEWPTYYGQAYKEACGQIGFTKCWVRPWEAYVTEIPQVFSYLGVSSPPAIVFMDLDAQNALAAITGRNINAETIIRIYNRLLEYRDFVNESGASGYIDRNNVFLLPEQISERESQLGLLGLNVWNLPINLPAWVWLLGTLAAGYKTASTNNKIGQIVFGSSTIILGGNYIMKSKQA